MEQAEQADLGNIKVLSIVQIASWQLHELIKYEETKPSVRACVPSLQRGAVWSPRQVELLWDSLLRGFPVGSLIICKHLQGQKDIQAKYGECINPTHHLLDGQQRSNAIALGFVDPLKQKNIRDILWLDINPKEYLERRDSTRSFLVRVTTVAHPWGYKPNDSTDILPALQMRDALKSFGWRDANDKQISGKSMRPSPSEAWPLESKMPIPLGWLLEAGMNSTNSSEFWIKLKYKLECCNQFEINDNYYKIIEKCLDFISNQENSIHLESIYKAFARVLNAKIVLLELPNEVLWQETPQELFAVEEKEKITNVEHLFQRLNSNGTPLHPDDKIYSMIKAYWPSFEKPIRSNQLKHIPDAKFAGVIIRAALTLSDADNLHPALDVNKIRQIARGQNEKEKLYKNALDEFLSFDDEDTISKVQKCCELIDYWLLYRRKDQEFGVPAFIRSEIAYRSSEVYLLIFWLAKIQLDIFLWDLSLAKKNTASISKRITAIATAIHWFGINHEPIVKHIFSKINLGAAHGVINDSMFIGVFDEKIKNNIVSLHPSDIENYELHENNDIKSWRWGGYIDLLEKNNPRKANFIRLMHRGKSSRMASLLAYVQRDYMHDQFLNYDPSNIAFWEGYNKPWDYDHILAISLLSNKRVDNEYMLVCREFANTLGNLRLVPFEENRSDQATLAREKIITDDDIKNSFLSSRNEVDKFSMGRDAMANDDNARSFINTTQIRLVRVYTEWWNMLEVEALFE